MDMLESVKEVLHLKNDDTKRAKTEARLNEKSEKLFQVAEWNNRLYITFNGIPVKDSYDNIDDILKELKSLRETWIGYMLAHPTVADNVLRV